jgi:hypothetical protein
MSIFFPAENWQRRFLENTILKIFLTIALSASLALASDRASAYFVYDYGKMLDMEHKSQNINWNARILFQNPLVLDWDATRIVNDGGKIFLLQAEFPFDLGSFILTPSFLYGRGKWEKGDFEYFYGKPDLPNISGFDISLLYNLNHTLGTSYYFGNAKLLNNENAKLFSSDFYFGNAFYKYAPKTYLNLSTGFAYANMETDGALTAQNQGYFLFPYAFYNAAGSLNVKAVYGIADLSFESESANYGIKLGSVLAIDGEMNGDMHYKHRKFYGDDEIFDSINTLYFKNSGLVFSVIEVNTKKIKLGEIFLQYGIQKPFIIPFGRIFPKKSINDGKSLNAKDIFLTLLTANINIYF